MSIFADGSSSELPRVPPEPGVRPFTSGSQHADWEDRNCYRCKKGPDEAYESACPLYEAVTVAMALGTMPEAMARRMGVPVEDPPPYSWPCPERDLVEGEAP